MNTNYDVIVLGAGTTGLGMATLLAGKGVQVAIVDPFRIAAHHPRATHVDDETVRIMQALGAAHLEPEFLRHDVGGYEIYDAHSQLVRYMPWRPTRTSQGWYGDYQFFQPDFENLLRGRLHADTHATLRFGWRALEPTQDDKGVTLRIRDERHRREETLTARYLVACDGARSLVRGIVSPDVEDLGATHRSLILDIFPFVESAGVPETNAFTKAVPPNAITCLPISRGMVRFEWLLNPSDETADFEDPSRWYELIRPFFAPGDYRISRGDVYRWETLLPATWRDRRLFLAGDAAHQMPPHLGQGMGSGLRDVMNLAWKLAACINDGVDDGLLDTYQQERQPHVRMFMEMAAGAANGIEHMTLHPADLGEIPATAEASMPKPPLGPGLHGPTGDVAGSLSVQPAVTSGALLDDVVGYNFAVVGDPSVIGKVGERTRRFWDRIGASVVPDAPLALRTWLNEHKGHVVLVRPDRYVFGIAATSAELEDLTARLAEALGLAGTVDN